jgi:predicted RNase H-like nuclease (RuvC/YqgF family)
MTGVDKILVIVVLVFSVVFVVAAISGYTSTHKKIDGYEKQVTDAKAIAQKNSAEAANWKGLYDDLKVSDDQKNATIQSKDTALSAAQAAQAAAESEAKALKAAVGALETQISGLTGTVDQLQKKVQDLTDAFQSTKDELAKATDKNRDLEKQVRDLADLNTAAAVQAAKDKAEIERLNKKIIELQSPPGEKPTGTTGPAIDCQILEVKREGGTALVALDKGSVAGLKVDMKLFVWNSTQGYKGKITIIEVNENGAYGRIDWEDEGKKITAGDTATVQNF